VSSCAPFQPHAPGINPGLPLEPHLDLTRPRNRTEGHRTDSANPNYKPVSADTSSATIERHRVSGGQPVRR